MKDAHVGRYKANIYGKRKITWSICAFLKRFRANSDRKGTICSLGFGDNDRSSIPPIAIRIVNK